VGPDGPFGNLWTDIDIGDGTVVWTNNAGGSNVDDVYWNIRSKRNITPPAASLKNVTVGFPTTQAPVLNTARPWLEPLVASQLQPQNIYLAQLELRRGATGIEGVNRERANSRGTRGPRFVYDARRLEGIIMGGFPSAPDAYSPLGRHTQTGPAFVLPTAR
jgi:hypothetical protein